MIKEPIRKRGYHRALKRGEVWAKIRKSMREMMCEINKEAFLEAIEPSPFLKMIGLSEQINPVKIEYGKPKS